MNSGVKEGTALEKSKVVRQSHTTPQMRLFIVACNSPLQVAVHKVLLCRIAHHVCDDPLHHLRR